MASRYTPPDEPSVAGEVQPIDVFDRIPMNGFIRVSQQVAKAIAGCKTDVWKAQGFRDIVDEYFQNSLCSLDFLSALYRCHRRASDMLSLILLAMHQFEEEELEANSDVVDGGCVGNNYVRTLEILKALKGAGEPFTEEFFAIFHSLYHRQISMLQKLQCYETELAKKTKGIEACRNVLNAIFSATTTTVQICSAAVAAAAAPPVARVVEAGAASVMGLMKGHGSTDSNRGQGGPMKDMKLGLYMAILDLDELRVLVNALEITIEKVEQTVDFMINVSGKHGFEEMKKMLLSFSMRVDSLGKRADAPEEEICRARALLQQMVSMIPKKD